MTTLTVKQQLAHVLIVLKALSNDVTELKAPAPATQPSNLEEAFINAKVPSTMALCKSASEKRLWIATRRDYINTRNSETLAPATAEDLAANNTEHARRRAAMNTAREAAMNGTATSVLVKF